MDPNPDDFLEEEIASVYKKDRNQFQINATESTKKYAIQRDNTTNK